MKKTLLVCLYAGLAVFAGCATRTQGSSDRQQIMQVLNAWRSAFLAQNADGILVLCADDFVYEGRGKVQAKAAFLEDLEAMLKEGLADDVRINIENATVAIHGVKASVLPVAVCGTRGSNSMRLELAKANGRWRITELIGK